MTPRDKRAIRAATQSIRAINWIVDHPHEPVPTSIIRPAMDSFADFVVDQLTEALFFAIDLKHDEPHAEQHEPQQPDSLPEMGS